MYTNVPIKVKDKCKECGNITTIHRITDIDWKLLCSLASGISIILTIALILKK